MSARASLIDGGGGNDAITAAGAAYVLIGGAGNDSLVAAGDGNIVVFNRGDGSDVLQLGGGNNALSLGGGIGGDDLYFAREGTSLVVRTGTAEEIVLNNWYGGADPVPSVTRLQVITDVSGQTQTDPVMQYNFAALVERFDAALAAQPTLAQWALAPSLSLALIGGADTAQFGGVAAFEYGQGHPVQAMATEVLQAALEQLALPLANHTRLSADGNDTLDGGTAADSMAGGGGDDTYYVDGADTVIEAANAGIDHVVTSRAYALGANVEMLTLVGTDAVDGIGNGSENLLRGNNAANLLQGLDGSDLLQGGGGNDTLLDTSAANNLFDGGAGADALTGGLANELYIGGSDNDTIVTGTGRDIIAFNRGDGRDVISASSGADNTLSLGKGIAGADLRLQKSGNDLVLMTGADEQITLSGWYASDGPSVGVLQLIQGGATSSTEQYDFDAIVGRFDQTAAGGGTTGWGVAAYLEEFRTGSSNSMAIGGALAYAYATSGSLSSIAAKTAIALIGSSQFGLEQQDVLISSTSGDGGGVFLY